MYEEFDVKLGDTTLSNMIKRRSEAADGYWQSEYDLKRKREESNKLYLSKDLEEKLIDKRFQEVYSDNRLFTSIRTIVPFVTSRITQPQVIPVNDDDLSIQFAHDFETILSEHANDQVGRDKVKLAVQDLMRGQRIGILKWRYDSFTKDCVLEHLDPKSVVVDHKARLHEESRFTRHTYERSIGDLIKQFPDKKEKIFELFSIEKGTPSQLEKIVEIDENWLWVDIEDKRQLIVVWCYQNFVLGKSKDPNWREGKENILDRPMAPFIFFNLINDGSSLIDQSSLIEMAQHSQDNYNKRGQVIAENAKYGGIGVPIFAKGAIEAKDVAKVRFSPIQRVLLDTQDVGKAFTTWQSNNLPQFIVEDKYDERNNIDNTFGTPNIFRGEQSDNNTLGQDIIIRDQAEGRQAELVDCIDNAMERFYKLEAQFIYRYFDEEKYYKYLGDDGQFEQAVISQKKIADNLGIKIRIKAGTSIPVDRAQTRATAMELAKYNKIGTLQLYKDLAFADPEKAFKQYLQEQIDPTSLLEEVDKIIFDRQAEADIAVVMSGKIPTERDDISDNYLNYLNEWMLTDKFKKLDEKTKAQVSMFVDAILAKAQRKLAKMSMQVSQDPMSQPPTMAPGLQELPPPLPPPEPQPLPTPENPVE